MYSCSPRAIWLWVLWKDYIILQLYVILFWSKEILRDVNGTRIVLRCLFLIYKEEWELNEEKKKCGLYLRVSTEDQARERI